MSIKEFTCESCHKLRYMTYILECGHIKCKRCLESSSSIDPEDTDNTACRVCNNNQAELQENFLHEHLDLLTEIRSNFQNENHNAKCDLCLVENNHKIEFYCFDKNRYFCEAHFEKHNDNKDCLSMDKMEVLKDDFKILQTRRSQLDPMCSQNHNRDAEYICCGKLLCHRCKNTNHRNHKSTGAKDAIEQARNTIELEKGYVEKRRNDVKLEAKQLQEKISKHEQIFHEENKAVTNEFNEKIKRLVEERDDKLKKMEKEHKNKVRILEEAKERNEENLQTVYRFEKLAKLSLEILPPLQQIMHVEAIRKMLRKVNKHDDDDDDREDVLENFKPRKREKPTEYAPKLKIIPSLPPKPRTPSPPTPKPRPPSISALPTSTPKPTVKKDHIKIETRKPENSPRLPRKTAYKNSYTPSANTLTIKCPDNTKVLSDVTVDKNNNIYTADPTCNSILVFNMYGKFVEKIHTPCASIQTLCYFSDRIIFSTSDNKAYQVSIKDKVVNEIAEYLIFIKGRPFIKPHGMASSIDGNLLYVCDQADDQIYILNDKLKKMQSIGGITEPIAIAVAPNSNIYVLCRDNKVIVINEKNERRSLELGNLSGRAEYIATNQVNQIMISDTKCHCIDVYNEDGSKVRSFVGYSQTERVNSPVGITVDGEGRLIVAEEDSKQIKVFSQSVFQSNVY
ncbi:Tripartite motif protein L-TRIM [Oopsacas minuta]|uniref:Tripartite motif protein L-TRIM n=1 Tax=Oopsacas minuta TaxID=111878 RepID=A0AAV7JU61_9METZ|nr:Tripartite motif protein L-TRIM [Oopsacas minuta]